MNTISMNTTLKEITPDMLAYFLKKKHWEEVNSPNPRFFLFKESGGYEHSVELVVPKNREFKDYVLRISEAISTLAGILNVSQLSLIEEIKAINLMNSQESTKKEIDLAIDSKEYTQAKFLIEKYLSEDNSSKFAENLKDLLLGVSQKVLLEFQSVAEKEIEIAMSSGDYTKAKEVIIKLLSEKFTNDFVEKLLMFQNQIQHKQLVQNQLEVEEEIKSLVENKDYDKAEQLIAKCLTENLPDDFADNLRNLLEQVYFSRHLKVQGVTLGDDEFQFSISGRAVSYGVADTEQFIHRVQAADKLFQRTTERKLNKPFREKGSPSQLIKNRSALYISVPRPNSYAVSFKVGKPTEQLDLFPDEQTPEIINEFLHCLDLFTNSKEEELKEVIKDESYYKNFIALARELAPDGDEIKQVGFTARTNNVEKQVSITRKKKEVSLAKSPGTQEQQATDKENKQNKQNKEIEVTGQLLFADSQQIELGRIKLVDQNNNKHTIIVPPWMMSDIVRPLWEHRVTVTGTKRKKVILLKDIKKYDG